MFHEITQNYPDTPTMTDPIRKSALQEELQQNKPFRNDTQEAAVALLRTSSVVSRTLSRVVGAGGLTLAQYNVLRILRGAGQPGLPTLAIRDRMIDEGSTVTRLLDKLEKAELVERDRDRPDRRQVLCRITDSGLKVLEDLDEAVESAGYLVMGALSGDERQHLIAILDRIRQVLR